MNMYPVLCLITHIGGMLYQEMGSDEQRPPDLSKNPFSHNLFGHCNYLRTTGVLPVS
jgi:hypothetical protein